MRRDIGRLLDMLVSARHALEYVQDVTLEQFEADAMLRDAVTTCLIRLGEAARNMSEEARVAVPGIDWRGIVGLRNVLVHDYPWVRPERMWTTVTQDLPRLIATLEPLIPPEK